MEVHTYSFYPVRLNSKGVRVYCPDEVEDESEDEEEH